MVRDLWDLRVRGASSLVVEEENTAEAGLEIFSSQPTSAAEDDGGTVLKSQARAQSWDPERGLAWPLPRIPDTLVLCYLGCLLLRLPTRIGELVQWANGGNIPYRRAVSVISVPTWWTTLINNELALRFATGDARSNAFCLHKSTQDSSTLAFNRRSPVRQGHGSVAVLLSQLHHDIPTDQ